MRFSYHTEQKVPHPIDRVFDFFANPANLPLLMPAWQQARIDRQSLVPPLPRPGPNITKTSVAGAGSRVTLSFRPLPGLPLRLSWEAEIAAFVWNEHFCDAQLRGPFAYWKHCHYIRPVDHSEIEATMVADNVEYEIPFGLLGRLAHRVFLRHQIERTFRYRQSQLSRLLAIAPVTPQPTMR